MARHGGQWPHDERAEQAVLGSATIWAQNVPVLLQTLVGSDFYVPRHQRWFAALATLHARGEAIETSGVVAEMERMGEVDGPEVVRILATVAERNIGGAMRVVAEHSLRRRLLLEADQLKKQALDPTVDPAELLDETRAQLVSLETPLTGVEPDDVSVEDFIAATLAEPTPWIVDGLIRQGWRTVVVAREGQGKTWLLRQMAVCSAYGIHPLRFQRSIEPVRTLLIDLENPDDHLCHSLTRLVSQAQRFTKTERPVNRLWRRQGGINLRRRADRTEVETLLQRRRPQLLVMGPLYKSYRVKGSDSWDLVASEVQEILDDWRYRFELSILIEDHAPKGKDLVPFGSSLWLRWPEVGIALEEKHGELEVGRWRGDRMPTDWPTSLARGVVWPWEGRWARAEGHEMPDDLGSLDDPEPQAF